MAPVMLSLIVATASAAEKLPVWQTGCVWYARAVFVKTRHKGGIGKDGNLPWKLPEAPCCKFVITCVEDKKRH